MEENSKEQREQISDRPIPVGVVSEEAYEFLGDLKETLRELQEERQLAPSEEAYFGGPSGLVGAVSSGFSGSFVT